MDTKPRNPDRRQRRAARIAAKLLAAVDKTIAAADEARKLRRELDRAAVSCEGATP